MADLAGQSPICNHRGDGAMPSEWYVLGRIVDMHCRELKLQAFQGVCKHGTCDGGHCLALGLHGWKATLQSHKLLVVLQPPSMMPMQMPSICSILSFLGSFIPSGASPTAAVLARKLSRVHLCSGEGHNGFPF